MLSWMPRGSVLAAIALGPILVVAAAPAWAQEQRCQELGTACACSEPLDTSSFATVNDRWVNPSDSPSATQCEGELGNGASWYPEAFASPEPESGMPGGNTVNRVWRNTGIGVSHLTGSTPRSNSKRMCIRHYFNLSSDYSAAVGSACHANKLTQAGFGNSSHVISGQRFSTSTWSLTAHNFSKIGDSHRLAEQGSLSLDDCRNTWCRAEICLSGDLAQGDGIYAEGYVERVSDGKRKTWVRTFLGDSDGSSAQRPWIANMYRGGSCNGDRAFSHAMQAEWTTDAGQFIGAAYEVEGGSWSGGGGSDGGSDGSGDTSSGGDGSGGSTGGSASFDVSVEIQESSAILTSTLSGGVGPYEFLFDCENDGSWDGVLEDVSTPSGWFECPLASTEAVGWVWDQGANQTFSETVQIDGSGSSVSPPARPVLLP